jgi:hypothetical protein
MHLTDLVPGESVVLSDGTLVTRRFNGGLRVRGPIGEDLVEAEDLDDDEFDYPAALIGPN